MAVMNARHDTHRARELEFANTNYAGHNLAARAPVPCERLAYGRRRQLAYG